MQFKNTLHRSAMDALRIISSTIATPPNSPIKSNFSKPISSPPSFAPIIKPRLPRLPQFPTSRFTRFTAISPSISTETLDQDDSKFEWFCHWYAVMPVCDLDKRAPLGMKVMGLDVVVWWDKNDNAWKVFDDMCPHRLAPLSQGRIDQWGRLQCVYHGWCFGGSGDCKFIPQAPHDGPPVHSFSKACVGVYPSTVQNGILWFWPSTDPKYRDILSDKKPPYVPELDDPSFAYTTSQTWYTRDLPYGYEVLVENLIDPAHVPYAHRGIFSIAPPPSDKRDREGGSPIHFANMAKIDKNGFTVTELPNRKWNFVPPCLVLGRECLDDIKERVAQDPPRIVLFLFFAIPVSPGKSRLITSGPRNYRLWMDSFTQRWMHHIVVNLIIDSDLYFLWVQEEKLRKADPLNWRKNYFLPTKADVMVVAYRKWLTNYGGGQIDWGSKCNEYLPPTPPKEQLMDRYWSHVVKCRCCKNAYKGFNVLKISLQVFSLTLVATLAATKQSNVARNAMVVVAIGCLVGSKWLSSYIYKNFHFHDYNHAFK